MVIRKCFILAVAGALALCCTVPSFAYNASLDVGFVHQDAQIYPVGDLVDIEMINSGADISWGAFPRIVFFQMGFSGLEQNDRQRKILIRLFMEVNGQNVIDYWSQPFRIDDWLSHFGNNNRVDNQEIAQYMHGSGWLGRDPTRSDEAPVNTLVGLLDGTNLAAGFYTLGAEVYSYEEDNPPRETLLARSISTSQAYNPQPPTPQLPYNGEEVYGYPVFLSWNWTGGMIHSSDVMLYIIEGDMEDVNADPSEMVDNRNPSNTRFADHPQGADYHNYTGSSGTEQFLTAGKPYFWRVDITVPTMVGTPQTVTGSGGMFIFRDAGDVGGERGTGGRGQPGVGPGERQDPVFDLLANVLPPGMLTGLLNQFEGYSLNNIRIGGSGGHSIAELSAALGAQNIEIVNAVVE